MSDLNQWIAPDGTIYYWGGDEGNCTLACPVEFSVYGYRPSLAASSLLIALYGLCTVAQVFYGWRYKTWGFMSAMIAGCLVEILGYGGRIMMWNNPFDDAGFTMQIVLITIGPVFFSAAIYVLLSQIVEHISVKASRFQPKLFYWIFIPCDIVSLILQAVGGAMSSTSNGDSSTGVNIALAGLAFQVVTLVAFIALTVDYFIRSRYVWGTTKLPTRFLIFISFLAFSTVVILLRCTYRVYELNEGYSRDSEALRDQPLFIGLESVPVVLAAIALIPAHPGPVFYQKGTGNRDAEKQLSIGKKIQNTDTELATPESNESS